MEGVTFFRTVEREAKERPDLQLGTALEGVPVYIHETLMEHFESNPLILTTRGPRLAVLEDAALAEVVGGLMQDLRRQHDEREQDAT